MIKTIKLAIFDMDGTVFESHLDWVKIRNLLGIPDGKSILQEIYRDNNTDHNRLKILEEYEYQNTIKVKPIPGIFNFVKKLKKNHISVALVTNNNRKNTDYLLKKFNIEFDYILTREARLWKPSPDPILHTLNYFNCPAKNSISIGDSHYDVRASLDASIEIIFIIGNSPPPETKTNSITYFKDYIELEEICLQKHPNLFL